MLQSVDVLIGLTVVLLALSMVVTVVTQALTTMVNSRGYHLRRGLTDLLQQLDPSIGEDVSKRIATAVLTHPLVSGSQIPLLGKFIGRQRLGNVVHRDELTALLMRFAAGEAPQLNGSATSTLQNVLTANGITDPAATLARVRELTLQLERTSPDASTAQRHTTALLHGAGSDFVAKINAWFDQTMDRTAQRFTASTRAVTFVGAFVVAFGLQLDTPALVNRLAADDLLRAALLTEAQRMLDAGEAQNTVNATEAESRAQGTAAKGAASQTAGTAAAGPQTDGTAAARGAGSQDQGTGAAKGTEAQPQDTAVARGEESQAQATAPATGLVSAGDAVASTDAGQRTRDLLAAAGIIRFPTSTEAWWNGFTAASLPGMLITALLLTLGAPFWYSALSRLLQLRSLLAAKDDVQRGERQHETPPSSGIASGAPASIPASTTLAGERGDLAALG
jgi:hypothetical protein